MAKVPLTADPIKTAKFVLNTESVGLSPEQFFRLCRDNPELRLELTAQKQISVMKELQLQLGEYIANGARLGFLIYPPKRQVYAYRPDQPLICLDQPNSVSGDPELPGFVLDLTEIWQ
jgi:Uma2 family endonuclease